MPTKEQVYDQHIQSLMDQVYATCRACGITMLAVFVLDGEPADHAITTWFTPDENDEAPDWLCDGIDAMDLEEGVAA